MPSVSSHLNVIFIIISILTHRWTALRSRRIQTANLTSYFRSNLKYTPVFGPTSIKVFLPFRFFFVKRVWISQFCHVYCVSYPSLPSSVDHTDNRGLRAWLGASLFLFLYPALPCFLFVLNVLLRTPYRHPLILCRSIYWCKVWRQVFCQADSIMIICLVGDIL